MSGVDDLKSKIELFVELCNIPDFDLLSASDPFCVLSIEDSKSNRWEEIGRTETIMNNNKDPKFKKRFEIDYFFEEIQNLRVDVYDSDGNSTKLSSHDYLGSIETSLGELVAEPGSVLDMQLKNIRGKNNKLEKVIKKKNSRCLLRFEELSQTKDLIQFTIRGEKLDKKDLFGKSDPYLEFYRYREDGTKVQFHKTEVVKKTLNPQFKQIIMSMRTLCNGDSFRKVAVMCWDWDKMSAPDYIGSLEFTVNELIEEKTTSFELINEKLQKKKKKFKNSGILHFEYAKVIKQYSFLDYIKGGLEISLMVAIDFTGSNGAPEQHGSLHYRGGNKMNEYQQAICSVGSVLSVYDNDQQYPVWGYGAKINGQVSHCFSLTRDEANPEVAGVDGILQAYADIFPYIKLSGPTYFSSIIGTSEAISSAPFTQDNQHYSILLILTDGIINDMKKTIERVVSASKNPLSIVIVGVGNQNFEMMEELDGDDAKLQDYKGRVAKRDIVQFVPFKDFKNSHISALAKATLAEIPGNVLSFMRLKGISPGKGRKRQDPQKKDFDESKEGKDAPPSF